MSKIQPERFNASGFATPNLGFVGGGKEANASEFDTSAEDKLLLLVQSSEDQSAETSHEVNTVSQELDDPMSVEHVAVLGYN